MSAWAVTAFTTAACGLLALDQSGAGKAEKGGRGVYPRSRMYSDAPTSGRPPACSVIPRPAGPRAGIVRRDAELADRSDGVAGAKA